MSPVRSLISAFVVLLFSTLIVFSGTVRAQKNATQKLPSAEKVVAKYLKALGGKKRLAAVRDAVYEWTVHLKR